MSRGLDFGDSGPSEPETTGGTPDVPPTNVPPGQPQQPSPSGDGGDNAGRDACTGVEYSRFVDNHDGTVSDLKYRLMWVKNPNDLPGDLTDMGLACMVTHEIARQACQRLSYAGFADWRLPLPEEFKLLFNDPRDHPPSKVIPVLSLIRTFWT